MDSFVASQNRWWQPYSQKAVDNKRTQKLSGFEIILLTLHIR